MSSINRDKLLKFGVSGMVPRLLKAMVPPPPLEGVRMKKAIFAVLAVAVVSVTAFAQFPGPFRPRPGHGPGEGPGPGGPGPGGQRPVLCKIYTSDYTEYRGQGFNCQSAQADVIGSCIAGQKARGVINWDRCKHALQLGNKYKMYCSDGCGPAPL